MKVKLIITVDVNDWDYVTKEIDDVEEEYLQSIKELLSKFLWSHKIDTRDKGTKKIMDAALTKKEQERLAALLLSEDSLEYRDLFSTWLYGDDQPHTLIWVEVIRDSFTLL